MKLTVTRQQELHTDRKGRSEGATYQFWGQLTLDKHELEMVDRYAQGNYPIAAITHEIVRDAEWRKPDDMVLRLGQLTEGWRITTRFVSDARHAEKTVTEACQNFKGVPLMMEGYGGQEEFKI